MFDRNNYGNRGFTVVEIVIALALIAVFITLPIFAYTNYMKKSRDSQRKNDIGQIQYSLEQYQDANGIYPASLDDLVQEGYLASIPLDPLTDQPYTYGSNADGSDYQLSGTLEDAGSGAAGYIVATPRGATTGNGTPTPTQPGGGGVVPTGSRFATNTPAPSITPSPTKTQTPTPIPTQAPNSWQAMNVSGNQGGRYNHVTVWTGSEMIVWSGLSPEGEPFSELWHGDIYDPETDTWRPMSTTNQPAARMHAGRGWSGTEMIVFGGSRGGSCNEGSCTHNDGGRYNPTTDTWTSIPTPPAPITVGGASAYNNVIVSGNFLVFFEDYDSQYNQGGKYNLSTNTWSTISKTGAITRTAPALATVNNKVYVWGGVLYNYPNPSTYYNTGGVYDPVTDTWTAMSTTNAPSPRSGSTAQVMGARIFYWGGGGTGDQLLNDGGIYNTVTNTWTSVSTVNAPAPRARAHSAWTGTHIIIWGGIGMPWNNGEVLGDMHLYNPTTNTWTEVTAPNAPAVRYDYGMSSAWTGDRFIIWGGRESYMGSDVPLNEGSLYRMP